MTNRVTDQDAESKPSSFYEDEPLLHESEPATYEPRSQNRSSRPRFVQRLWRWLPWILVLILFIFSFQPHDYIRRYRASLDPIPPNLEPVSNRTIEKALIIASYDQQDVSWIDSVPSDWTINRYLLDDSNPLHNLTVPRNQGREAAAYLSYVVDNYDILPDYMVFLQGHARAWHQPEHVVQLIRALNLSAVEENMYVNLKCEERPACDGKTWKETDNTTEEWVPMLKVFWESQMGPVPKHLFPNLTAPHTMKMENWSAEQEADIVSSQIRESARSPLSVYNTPDWIALPPILQYRCCGQFAVSKAAIRQHPKSFWKRMQAPLIRDLWDHEGWGSVDTYGVGLFYEVTWHLLFGDKRTQATGTACPSKSYCRRVMFSGMIDCANENGNTGMGDEVDHWEVVNCKTPFDMEIKGLEHGHGTAWDEERNMFLLDILHDDEERWRLWQEEVQRQQKAKEAEEQERERARLEEQLQKQREEEEEEELEKSKTEKNRLDAELHGQNAAPGDSGSLDGSYPVHTEEREGTADEVGAVSLLENPVNDEGP